MFANLIEEQKKDRDRFITQLASEICKSGKSIKHCFDVTDVNGDGKIGIDEFRSLVKKVNSKLSEYDVLVLFSEVASIGFTDFDVVLTKAKVRNALEGAPDISLWSQIAREITSSGKTAQQAFDMIDANHDGRASLEELWLLMTKINTAMSADSFKCAFALVDTSSDGSISPLQFQVAVDTAKARAEEEAKNMPNGHDLGFLQATKPKIMMKIKRHVYMARGGAPPYRGSYLTATDFVELDASRSIQEQINVLSSQGGSPQLASFPAFENTPGRWEFPSPGGQAVTDFTKTVQEVFGSSKAVIVLVPMMGMD